MQKANSFSKYCHKLFLFGVYFFISCSKSDPEPAKILTKDNKFEYFHFYKSNNPSLPFDISCQIVGDTIEAKTISGTDISNLQASFSSFGKPVLANNIVQKSGINRLNFTEKITFSILAEDGSATNYHVKFVDSKLPTLFISTNSAIQSKTIYVKGQLRINEGFNSKPLYSGDIEIRGRGNSTWNFPKKPYKIKLDKKSKLFGMNEDRDWILLANYADKTLIRNELGFELSRIFGFKYTPDSRFVEVVLNNEYVGNYQLVEQIEVGKYKVDVAEQKIGENDPNNISGGYLVEIDGFASREKSYFYTNQNMPISISYPDDEDITLDQKSYIKDYFNNFEKSLFSTNFDDNTNGYKQYFDIDSYVNFYLLSELIGNPDVFWSTFMYKNKNSNLIFTGPVWDFDIAANNDNRLGDTQEKLMLTVAHEPKQWIKQLMRDKAFRAAVRNRWNEIKNKDLKNITPLIDKITNKLPVSQEFNFIKWPILNEKVYLNLQVAGSYHAEVDYLKKFLTNRVLWLDTQFNGSKYD